jgi:hypothetical protein
MGAKRQNITWPPVIDRAADIVLSYDTGVTLRQLFYRLVAEELLPNRLKPYQRLSALTAQARRAGAFPSLVDNTRGIERPLCFGSPEDASAWLRERYRRDRTEGQQQALYVGVEKHALAGQLRHWFGDLGLPVVALGGHTSQTLVDEVRADIAADGRPAVLLYGGDFDPSGVDIDRDFVERVGLFAEVVRVALSEQQVAWYELPPLMGKTTDARASAFVAKFGRLVQVELDALPPDVLHSLYQAEIDARWDMAPYKRAMARERKDRKEL